MFIRTIFEEMNIGKNVYIKFSVRTLYKYEFINFFKY